MSRLSGRVAVVTGASKGIGAEIARQLAAQGAAVVVNYASSKEGADKVVREIQGQGGRAISVQADVSRAADGKRLFEEAVRAFGPIDILVNNAGLYEVAALAKITEEHFHKHFNLNVLGLLLTTQEAVQHFPEQGGSIINVSSIVSTLSPAGTAIYNATKAAVDSLTRTLSKELAPRHIRVNSVNPGLVETEGLHASPLLGARDSLAGQTPLGRIAQPDDIAPSVVFLASAESGFITGETLYITGGLR